MNARLVIAIVLLLVLALAAGSGWLFWIQNQNHVVLTSLEFPGGFRFGRQWRVAELMGASGVVGFLLALVPMLWLWWRASGEARRLRRQVAIGSGESSSFR